MKKITAAPEQMHAMRDLRRAHGLTQIALVRLIKKMHPQLPYSVSVQDVSLWENGYTTIGPHVAEMVLSILGQPCTCSPCPIHRS